MTQGPTLRNTSELLAERRMLGDAPGLAALGRGPSGAGAPEQVDYEHPAAGWGAARSVTKVLARSREPLAGPRVLAKMNHEDGGFDCPGCAWPDSQEGLKLDFCENGVKHVTWELTGRRVEREFFASHTVSELRSWSDYALEAQGRLVEPMAYDAATDKYVPIAWADAFALVGETLRGLESPNQASFYTSGRLSNEATFLYQLWVREFGTNNLPDCSNMCHEASGRGLQASLGTGKGTCDLADWDEADLIFVMGGQRGVERAAHAHDPRGGLSPRRRDRPRQPDRRSVHGYLAVPYDIPPGSAAGYMPELNVLVAIGDYSEPSDQPLMKHIRVEIEPASTGG